MSSVVAGVMASHAPTINEVNQRGGWGLPRWQPLFSGLSTLAQWLEARSPDSLIVVTNDHLDQFGFEAWPTFAISAVSEYPLADEGKGAPELPPLRGDRELGLELARQLIDAGFDLAVCHRYTADHGIYSPLSVLDPARRWPIVVLHANTILEPLPSPGRYWALGEALGEALRGTKLERRVAVLAFGGLSHELSGPRFGIVDGAWDRACLEQLERDPRALLAYTPAEIAERGGREGLEIYHWLIARAALGREASAAVRFYTPIGTMGFGGMAFSPAPRED